MNKKKIFIIFPIVFIFIVFSLCAIVYIETNNRVGFKKDRMIFIDTDDNIDSVFHKLEEPALSLTGFTWMCHYSDYKSKIHTGAYLLKTNMTSLSLFRTLHNGLQTPVKVIIPSVRTMETLAHTIGEQLMLNNDTLKKKFRDTTFYKKLGYTKETFPCLFLANTYKIYWNTSLKALMQRIINEHRSFWNKQRRALAKEAHLTPNGVVTIASIVNEESNCIEEFPIIAGIYINRLNRGMPLQSCPTVKFAMKDFGKRRIYLEDLKYKNPYNTYIHTGLPPGPIRIPTIKAVDAVLHYTHHKYLFMCAKEDFSGRHNFAQYNWQHSRNARRYAAALNKRKIK